MNRQLGDRATNQMFYAPYIWINCHLAHKLTAGLEKDTADRDQRLCDADGAQAALKEELPKNGGMPCSTALESRPCNTVFCNRHYRLMRWTRCVRWWLPETVPPCFHSHSW